MARRRRGPRIELRLQFLAFLILLGIAGIVSRLWWVQVARGAKYTARLASRSTVTVRIPSVRGEIRDRNGIPLVENRASYEVDFYLPDMVRGFRAIHGWAPTTQYMARVRGMMKLLTEEDIVQIVNDAVIPRLQDLEIARDYNAKRLQLHYRNNTEVPYTYIEDLDFPTIAKFSEHDVGLPGVDISVKPVRQYLYGALAAHLLGYVGMPRDIDQQPDIKDFNFYQPDTEGKSNIELAMDKYLRGTPGVRVMQRNVKGVIDSELRVEQPKPGANVYLTVDARIQFIAERALRAIGRGAAVVVDPNNGDILAMASVPSYDPNKFIPSISLKDWQQLESDDTDPLTNRAISAYAPGSTFKLLTALAGLRKGLAGSHFTCTGGVTYGNKYMKCWIADKGGAHGTLGLTDAIKFSCNAYFYQYGNAAGIDNIDAVSAALGIGQKTAVPLTGESAGILPGPEWMAANNPNERWSNGQTANVSIGQGSVEATPLQMAMAVAAVANGGVSFKPRLISKVTDQDGRPVLDDDGKPVAPPAGEVRSNLQDSKVTNQQIELVRRGMWKVVNEPGGTGGRAKLKDVQVAGKTGTAQFWRGNKKDNHTWFVCFAPYEKPKYAICVFVQGAKAGGAVSAPIANKILEESLALERGYDPRIEPLTPAKGSFDFVEQVSFTSEVQASLGPEETADNTEMPEKKPQAEKRQVAAQPDIRADSDERGKVNRKRVPAVRGRPTPGATPDRRSIFERFFRPNRPGKPEQRSQPPPARRPGSLF
jgi:penicillin-binding protein 2